MPVNLQNTTTIIIDKIRIDQFSVDVRNNIITIHFSKGSENELGEFIVQSFDRIDIVNANIDPTLHAQVKDSLYTLLLDKLNSST
jgi:hypothetical protein